MTQGRPPEDAGAIDDIAALELAMARSRRRRKVAVGVVIGVAAAVAAVIVVSILTRADPGPGRFERLMTQTLPDLELAWFDSRVDGRSDAAIARTDKAFEEARAGFVDACEDVSADLADACRGVVEWMKGAPAGPVDTKSAASKAVAQRLDDALAKLEPRYMVEFQAFRGILERSKAIEGAMLAVHEVLGSLCYDAGNGGAPIRVRVVRRADPLPATIGAEGYVRTDDLSIALVLHDNATRDAARFLLPGVEDPDLVFDRRFGDDVRQSLMEPHGRLLKAAIGDLRAASGASAEAFDRTATLVARRNWIARRLEEKAEAAGLGLRLKVPDGLVWPASFLVQLRRENDGARRRGEALLSEDHLQELEKIGRQLAEEEPARVVEALSRFLSGMVAFHEARHVADNLAAVPISQCVIDRTYLRRDDDHFLRSVDHELRAAVTSVIEVPAAARTTVLDLLAHYYMRRGTVYFYAARILLNALAFPPEDPGARGGDHFAEVAVRLAGLDPQTLHDRALALAGECFGGYVPLRPVECP